MTNLEKFKKCALEWDYLGKNGCSVTISDDKEIRFKDMNEYIAWLLSEYKEPILDSVEKEYLQSILSPFKDRVKYVVKHENDFENEYISISVCRHNVYPCNVDVYPKDDYIRFPPFKKGTMYKGMEVGKEYTLEELGLFSEVE